jgi:hypothetical protein
MRLIHSGLIVALDLWSDLLGCHAGVRAGVLRRMPAGIPAWQAKRLLHGTLDKVRHLSRRPPGPSRRRRRPGQLTPPPSCRRATEERGAGGSGEPALSLRKSELARSRKVDRHPDPRMHALAEVFCKQVSVWKPPSADPLQDHCEYFYPDAAHGVGWRSRACRSDVEGEAKLGAAKLHLNV